MKRDTRVAICAAQTANHFPGNLGQAVRIWGECLHWEHGEAALPVLNSR
jgi:hypothetical protein